MRTSIDLPDELFRDLKVKAAQEGVRLKELVRRYVEQGLRQSGQLSGQTPCRQRSELPVARAATGKALPDLTNAETNRLLEEEELKAAHARGD